MYDPYDINYNNAVTNIDRSFYRNYLFRRRLLTSESSKNQSEIENEEVSVHSDNTSNNNNFLNKSTIRKTENTTTQQNSTNLFKYYYNDNIENDQVNYIDPSYSKFDPNTADEEDYKNLYQQLVSQNRLLKSEVLDKIKRNEDNNQITFSNVQDSGESVKKIEEEEKEIEKKAFSKAHSKINQIYEKMNKFETTLKEMTDNSDKSNFVPKDKSSVINTTSSLSLNNENKNI